MVDNKKKMVELIDGKIVLESIRYTNTQTPLNVSTPTNF